MAENFQHNKISVGIYKLYFYEGYISSKNNHRLAVLRMTNNAVDLFLSKKKGKYRTKMKNSYLLMYFSSFKNKQVYFDTVLP